MSKHNHQSRRGILGLLVGGWLSLGLQPCLVAAAEHGCPHCPPESAAEMPAHHEGHAHHAESHESHETDEAAPTCASMQADCCGGGSALVSKRAGGDQPESPDSPAAAAAPGPVAAPWPWTASVPTPPPEPRARSAPIHVLNCVYLK